MIILNTLVYTWALNEVSWLKINRSKEKPHILFINTLICIFHQSLVVARVQYLSHFIVIIIFVADNILLFPLVTMNTSAEHVSTIGNSKDVLK